MDHVLEQDKLCKASIQVFKFLHLWPKHKNDNNRIRFAIMAFLIAPIISTLSVYPFVALYSGNYAMTDLIESLAVNTSAISMCFGLFTLLKDHALIARTLSNIGNYRQFGKPPKTDDTERNSNRIVFWWVVFAVITSGMFFSFGLIRGKQCLKDNEIYGYDRICGTCFPTWLPFEVSEVQSYFLFALQYIAASIILTPACAFNIFLWQIVESVMPKFDHFMDLLKVSLDPQDRVQSARRYRTCVEYQKSIILLVEELNEVFGKVYFVHMTVSSAVLGISCVNVLIDRTIKPVVHAVGWTFVLWMMCNVGQKITNKSDEMAGAIYEMPWYEMDVQLQKSILIMLFRTQKTLSLNPLGFGMISLITFKEIVSRAYSLITLLERNT